MVNKDDIGSAIKRLERWLAKHRRRFLAGLRPGATSAELAAVAKAISQPIPGDLQALLSWRNGQGDEEIGYFEEHWLFMGTTAIVAAWSELKSAAANDTTPDAELQEVLDHVASGKPVGSDLKRSVRERAQQMKKQILATNGVQNIGVDLIRELRGEPPAA